jgi:glycosyltransferase involved in cell wall biosynthesis
MCAWNGEKTIARAIKSVLNQTRSDFTFWILNNGSTDKTDEIIKKYNKKDKRVKMLYLPVNNIVNAINLSKALRTESSAKYHFTIDADDEYVHDFFEVSSRFMDENKLDIVTCGYDVIDEQTGSIIKTRIPEDTFTVSGKQFQSDFIKYRPFTPFTWGKLYRNSQILLSDYILDEYNLCSKSVLNYNEYKYSSDSIYNLFLFRKARRIGVLGKSVYKYYQSQQQISSRVSLKEKVSEYYELYLTTRRYLESYGKVSKFNCDYLYAIYLSTIDDSMRFIFERKDVSPEERLELIKWIFSRDETPLLFSGIFDPEFKNLAARNKFLEENIKKILLEFGQTKEVNEIVNLLKGLKNERLC